MSDAVVFMHFKKFTNKLVELLQAMSKKQISDFDSREIELKLFDWKLKLYEDIQIILHIISVAAMKSSFESVRESYGMFPSTNMHVILAVILEKIGLMTYLR